MRDAGVHGADDDVDVVALDQLVDVVGGLARVALVVDLEVLDLAATELAALLVDASLKPFSIMSPSAAKVPVDGSIRPTLTGPARWRRG
jgi:hypothetical protein